MKPSQGNSEQNWVHRVREKRPDSLLPRVSCTQVAELGNSIWVVLPPKYYIHPIFSISTTVALVKVLMSFLELSFIEPISRRAAWADPSRPEISQFHSSFLCQDEIPPGHCFSSAVSWFPILCLKCIFPKISDVCRIFSITIAWDLIRISGPTLDPLNRNLHFSKFPQVFCVPIKMQEVLLRTCWKGIFCARILSCHSGSCCHWY